MFAVYFLCSAAKRTLPRNKKDGPLMRNFAKYNRALTKRYEQWMVAMHYAQHTQRTYGRILRRLSIEPDKTHSPPVERWCVVRRGKEAVIVTNTIPEVEASEQNELTVHVSRTNLLLIAAVVLLLLFGTLISLVWTSRAVSSMPILGLVLSVALLMFVTCGVFLLIIAGHFSEKTASKLLGSVLGKVPGLRVWIPKVLSKGPSRSPEKPT
jgi:hypothetical protein